MSYIDTMSGFFTDVEKSVVAIIKLLLALLLVLFGSVGFVIGFICGLMTKG